MREIGDPWALNTALISAIDEKQTSRLDSHKIECVYVCLVWYVCVLCTIRIDGARYVFSCFVFDRLEENMMMGMRKSGGLAARCEQQQCGLSHTPTQKIQFTMCPDQIHCVCPLLMHCALWKF